MNVKKNVSKNTIYTFLLHAVFVCWTKQLAKFVINAVNKNDNNFKKSSSIDLNEVK